MRPLLLSLLLFCGNALAAVVQYDFSYGLESGEHISGSLLGELQADADTIVISELLAIDYSGADVSPSGLGSLEANVVSLSGSALNFSTTVPYGAVPNGLVWFDGGTTVSVYQLYYDPISPELQQAWLIEGESINAASWTITAVPVPAAAWLFASALIGLRWLRR